MVRGLNIFREYFGDFTDSYIIIGGTACNQQFESLGLTFRATTDIDIVLVIEALDSPFVKKFWEFIQKGNYNKNQREEKERKNYRFEDPVDTDFPSTIELFSKKPDVIQEIQGMRFTPIPVEDDLSSLSAILLDDAYYNFAKENTQLIEGLAVASTALLIALKSHAFNNMLAQKEAGKNVDSKKIKKHKIDVLRLALTLNTGNTVLCPKKIHTDIATYINLLRTDNPDIQFLKKETGLKDITLEGILSLLSSTFFDKKF